MLSLRVRLTLVLAGMVLLTVSVGFASLWVQRGIQTEVSALRSNSVDLTRQDLDRIGLEVEGVWDPSSGWFVATGIETLPGMRRPKLRGAIQAIDRTAGTLRLFGVEIRVDEATELLEGGARSLEHLRRGADHRGRTSRKTDHRIRVTIPQHNRGTQRADLNFGHGQTDRRIGHEKPP